MTSYRLRAYIYLVLVAAIWGIAGPVIKFTLGAISPLSFLAYRFAISAMLSVIYFLVAGINISKIRDNLNLVLIYGLTAFTIALGALFIGLAKTTVLDLTVISLVGPLLVAAGGALFFKDHITSREKVGIAVVVLGAAFTAASPAIMEGEQFRFSGNILIIVFLLADSAAALVAKKAVQKDVDSLALTNFGFIIGALTIIPLTIFLEGPSNTINQITQLSLPFHLGVWYMAVASGSLAYFLYVAAQKSIEVSEAVLFRYLGPLFSVPLAIVWLGEKISTYYVVGAIFITIGIFIAERKRQIAK